MINIATLGSFWIEATYPISQTPLNWIEKANTKSVAAIPSLVLQLSVKLDEKQTPSEANTHAQPKYPYTVIVQ